MFFSKSKNVLGIDIGTSHIKAVELKPGPDKPYLVSYGMVNVVLPQDTGTAIDPIAQVAEVLKALHEKAQFGTNQVVLSLPSNVAFVSVFDFPKMSDKELQNAVEFKAQQFIPLPMADVNFSWQVLDEDQNQGKKTEIEPKVRVLLTAVPKNVVNNYLKVLDSAGLNPIAIEIESISAIRALIPANSNESILIVDVGAKSTIISMVHSGHLYASRHVSVGGDSITSSIAKSLGITFERAEALKRAPESTGDLSKSTSSVANSVIEVIRGEVQQMNLISENQGKHISKIILSGGGARYPGITELLKQIGPAVEPANPLAPLSFDQNSEDSLHSAAIQLSIAIGLALRP